LFNRALRASLLRTYSLVPFATNGNQRDRALGSGRKRRHPRARVLRGEIRLALFIGRDTRKEGNRRDFISRRASRTSIRKNSDLSMDNRLKVIASPAREGQLPTSAGISTINDAERKNRSPLRENAAERPVRTRNVPICARARGFHLSLSSGAGITREFRGFPRGVNSSNESPPRLAG